MYAGSRQGTAPAPQQPVITTMPDNNARPGVTARSGKQSMIAALALLLVSLGASASADEKDRAVTVYFGRMTDAHSWHDIFLNPGEVGFKDANLFAGAFSYTFARYLDDALNFEIEGQAVRYFGDQDNWEFNVPVVIRWKRFPWESTVATTAAFGIGPSYATEIPPVEVELNKNSEQLLVYWFIEFTAGPPKTNWEAIVRLHHRSGGFGAITNEGGSNSLALGVKYRF